MLLKMIMFCSRRRITYCDLQKDVFNANDMKVGRVGVGSWQNAVMGESQVVIRVKEERMKFVGVGETRGMKG